MAFMFNTTHQHAAVTEGPNCIMQFDLDIYDENFPVPNVTGQTESWHDNPGFIPTTIVYAFTFLLGVIGNGLVIFALLGYRKARNVTSSFLVSLAVADLLFLLVCVPYETVDLLINEWPMGHVFCKLVRFVEMLSASASVLNLIAVSLERLTYLSWFPLICYMLSVIFKAPYHMWNPDPRITPNRYIVIVHPMRARSYCTMGKTRKYIAGVWIAAFLLSLPSLVIMKTWTIIFYDRKCLHAVDMQCSDYNLSSDSDKILFACYQMVIMFILPVIIMAVSYSVIIHTLWISNKELAKMTKVTKGGSHDAALAAGDEGRNQVIVQDPKAKTGSNTSLHKTKDHSVVVRDARKQIIKMLLVVLGIFLCCWGPKLCLNILRKIPRPSRRVDLATTQAFYTMQLIHLLPYIQSCVNPLIYSYMSKNFRKNMRKAFQERCHCDPGMCCRRRINVTLSADVNPGTANGTPNAYTRSRRLSNTALL